MLFCKVCAFVTHSIKKLLTYLRTFYSNLCLLCPILLWSAIKRLLLTSYFAHQRYRYHKQLSNNNKKCYLFFVYHPAAICAWCITPLFAPINYRSTAPLAMQGPWQFTILQRWACMYSFLQIYSLITLYTRFVVACRSFFIARCYVERNDLSYAIGRRLFRFATTYTVWHTDTISTDKTALGISSRDKKNNHRARGCVFPGV